ncbi:MAG TPA: substrate-binding domain-containing protein [Streptosporangiaceae bacterium]|nr:substrate-binding domain-containing protein [Streptosporangiaceae bacterium]
MRSFEKWGPSVTREAGRSTLVDIAAAAGVSVSAVSKVLNGRTDVAAATRARIAALLRENGYQVASRLGFGVVDLLIADLHSPWAEELLRGTVQAADESAASVVVATVDSPAGFARWLDRAAGRGTDGALCVLHLPDSSELQRLAAARIPLVVIDPAEEPGAGIRSVGTTNWQGGLTATRHLIELGHRRIGIICGPEQLWSSRARLAGYRAALQAAGLPAPAELVRRDDFCIGGGRRQGGHLLDLAAPPTAVVAGNDSQAFGVLQALAERGLRAPRDLSVVGFDDVPVASWATPALTTIRQPLAAMAAAAFGMLRGGRSGGPGGGTAEPQHVELATSLVIRESTAPPGR